MASYVYWRRGVELWSGLSWLSGVCCMNARMALKTLRVLRQYLVSYASLCESAPTFCTEPGASFYRLEAERHVRHSEGGYSMVQISASRLSLHLQYSGSAFNLHHTHMALVFVAKSAREISHSGPLKEK